jgi:hypothetical protein
MCRVNVSAGSFQDMYSIAQQKAAGQEKSRNVLAGSLRLFCN